MISQAMLVKAHFVVPSIMNFIYFSVYILCELVFVAYAVESSSNIKTAGGLLHKGSRLRGLKSKSTKNSKSSKVNKSLGKSKKAKGAKGSKSKETLDNDIPNIPTSTPTTIDDCKEGFRFDEISSECIDIDECKSWDICGKYYQTYNDRIYSSPTGSCTNTEGGYECNCLEGTYYDEMSKTCIDVNECELDADLCGEAECINMANGYFCQCYTNISQEEIFNPIEKTCHSSTCGTILELEYMKYYLSEESDKCGGDSIGTCKVEITSVGDYEWAEAYCNCGPGYKAVYFYDPNDAQYGQTFATCIDETECEGKEEFCTCGEGFEMNYSEHKCVPVE